MSVHLVLITAPKYVTTPRGALNVYALMASNLTTRACVSVSIHFKCDFILFNIYTF